MPPPAEAYAVLWQHQGLERTAPEASTASWCQKNRRVSTPSFRNRASAHERIHIRHFIESSSRGTASLASPAAW